MARVGGTSPKMLLMFRGTKPVGRCMSEQTEASREAKTQRKSTNYSISKCDINNQEDEGLCYWMPEARTGIYCPKGHEGVMDDVPEGAASLKQIYWLRNVDGVDKPKHDYQFHI